jgi:hypothetical protein
MNLHLIGRGPLRRASHGVYLMGLHLLGVHLIGVYFMGVYLVGLHLLGLHHVCASWARISWVWRVLRLSDISIWGFGKKSLYPTVP